MELLLQALVEIRNNTLAWPRGSEEARMIAINKIAQEAIDTFGWVPIKEGLPVCNEFGISDPVFVAFAKGSKVCIGVGEFFSGPGRWVVVPTSFDGKYPDVTHWQYAVHPSE